MYNLQIMILRPEQENDGLMKDLVRKFSEPGDLVLGELLGTLSTAKACPLMENNKRFVGCGKDSYCVKCRWQGLLKVMIVSW